MNSPFTTSLVILTLLSCSTHAQEREPQRILKLDAVELIAGREVPGQPGLYSDHQGTRYLFSNDANKSQFDANPAQWRVQMDGGCGRMGSLSGHGRPAWHAVYQDKLYLFASEGCREGFLKNPEASLERDDPVPEWTKRQQAQGRRVLNQVLAVMGGADVIDAVRNYRESYSEDVQSNNTAYRHQRTVTIDFAGPIRTEDVWNDQVYINVVNGPHSFVGQDGTPMFESAQRELRRQQNRLLLTILKARQREDFGVGLIEPVTIGEQSLKRLQVAFDGSTTTLLLEPTTHLVQAMEYRGRGPDHYFGTIRKSFDEYRPVNGVMLPHASIISFEGRPIPSSSQKLRIEVNVELPDDQFYRSGKP